MKPGTEQSDEADERGGAAEKEAGDNHDKTDVGQRLATPVLALRVALSLRGRKAGRAD